MSITAVHHLNCGTLCPLAGSLLSIGRMVCHCLLIETARDGLILVDTGFSTFDVAAPERLPRLFRIATGPRLAADETAVAHVRRLGFAPSDVRHIVITHLDLDHAGGLVDFPEAIVHVHTHEHAAAMARATRNERTRYLPTQWAHGPRWSLLDTGGELWRGLPAVQRLPGLDVDVGIVALHGHTHGHSGVVVGGNSGEALLHAGDAVYTEGTFSRGSTPWALRVFERRMAIDDAARLASIEHLIRLHGTGVRIVCAHDPVQFA